MATLADVYEKFGFAAEAAQLLEKELGTQLFVAGAIEAGLFEQRDGVKAKEILDFVNKQTLGQLLKSLHRSTDLVAQLEDKLQRARSARNRLFHSFYREHNLRRNTEDGRAIMLSDLENIHDTLLDAYKAVMRLTGIDLDRVSPDSAPTRHLPI